MKRHLITIYDLIRRDGREPGGRPVGTYKVVWGPGVHHVTFPTQQLSLLDLVKPKRRTNSVLRRMKRALARVKPLFRRTRWADVAAVDVPGQVEIRRPKGRYLQVRFVVSGPKPRGTVKAYVAEG